MKVSFFEFCVLLNGWNSPHLNMIFHVQIFLVIISLSLEHVVNQLFLLNESSISQASYRTMVLTICFQLFKKQTILWR